MLRTHQLSYQYPGGSELAFPDITAARGEHWLILGQSGSGKTTLLHLLAGLLRAKTGSIFLADTNITDLSGRQLDRFRGQQIGLIFQQPHFIRSLSVLENLTIAQSLAGRPVDKEMAQSLLTSLGIADKAHKPVDRLSVGEQQRVTIARAVINQPPLLLADEPTSALDDHNTERVIQLLEAQAKAVNATLLIVTHDKRLADHFAKKIVLAAPTSRSATR